MIQVSRRLIDAPSARAAAGPVLIVAAVLVVLHDFAFSGFISIQHIDVLPQWLPTYCFLGKTLAAGHVPAYNPYSLAGTPFAADPQSGWTYLPAMLLFSALNCGRAIRWFIVVQPIMAGLGVYAFLRSERLSRPAATAAGLVLAMAMADSYLSLSLPFAGTIAWSALLLAAASRFMRASSWSARFGWALASAIAWGQLADAHMSNGLLMGTALLGVYLLVRCIAELREGRWRPAVLSLALLLVAFPLVDLAVFLPRLAYIHRSSLGLGYLKLQETAAHLAHRPPLQFGVGAASPPTWPLGLTTAPGSYLGAAGLALTFAGWRARKHFGLVLGLAAYTAACYVLSLKAVAERFQADVVHTGPGQLWLHEPARFRYGALLAIALLVGFGVEAWREARTPIERVLMVLPAVVVFGLLPPINHVTHDHTGFVTVMAVVALGALALTAWRPRLLAVIPALLAVELVANGFIGQGAGYSLSGVGIEQPGNYIAWAPLRKPDVDAAAYLRPAKIARSLQRTDSRYISLAFAGFHRERGYLLLQLPKYWGLLANQRSMLLHIRDAQGYNPAQLYRYWSFVRAVDPKYMKYNASFFSRDSNPVAKNLLQIASTVSPASSAPLASAWVGTRVQTAGAYSLYSLAGAPPLATAYERWQRVSSPDDALRAVLAPGFDPRRSVVVEQGSPVPATGPSQSIPPRVDVRAFGPQAVTLGVRSNRATVVLVRIPFDTQWHAELDGRPAAVLNGDYVDMAVAVPEGTHTIELGYDDPRIGYGLLGSGASVLALAAAALVTRRRTRRTAG